MYWYLDCPQGFAIGFNTLWKHKSNNKGKSYFMTPVWPIHGGQEVKLTGYLDCPPMVSQYLLIHSEAIIATTKEISGKTGKTVIFYPSLTHKGGWGGKTDRLLRLSTYAFPIPLNTFWSYKSNNKEDIRQKLKISYFMTPVWPIRGGRGVKLTGYLDSPHMLSQYLLIHSEAIKATIKEI